MKAIRRFTVHPVLPDGLSALEEMAANLRWSWHEETRRLFADIDPELWRQTAGDPVGVLGGASGGRLRELAADSGFLSRVASLRDDLRNYLTEPRWYQNLVAAPTGIAYFSPEFGITAALPQYSGGLGILAGDHLKAASDLGVPIIGVGLFYRAGYFRQTINADGWQSEEYPLLDPDGMPLKALRDADGALVRVELALPNDRVLRARIWVATVGRIPLLLLDTDLPENPPDLRAVTDRLYGGVGEHRLLQELLLGIGGMRALHAYCERSATPFPEVVHMNEGHAAFLGLERIDHMLGRGLDESAAIRLVRAGSVFTTHTPVPAGIDRFDPEMVKRYFDAGVLPRVHTKLVMDLGLEQSTNPAFNMAHLALRLAQHVNGVSRLHGEVSREMFGELWPGFDADEVPIGSITNGVHAATWTHPRVAAAIGTASSGSAHGGGWSPAEIDDEKLWELRAQLRSELVDEVRGRVSAAWSARHGGAVAPQWIANLLDPNVLTIGFARRVPTYKRLTLMLSDPERLRALLTNPDRPIQIVVAGKSHPADDGGKRLIQQVVEFAKDPALRQRMVFLADYDMELGRHLYPGTDIWLNNPVRPMEACGTSGMKAALNGSLNLSILDGWWAECFEAGNGWAIASAIGSVDDAARDRAEADSMYDILEHQVVPAFYSRDERGLPRRWLDMVRSSLGGLSAFLSAERMVAEYVNQRYQPAAHAVRALRADGMRSARDLAKWVDTVRAAWAGVAVLHVESGGIDPVPQVGAMLRVRVRVAAAGLAPEDLLVEAVAGRVRHSDTIEQPILMRLEYDPTSSEADSGLVYSGTIPLEQPGSFGYTVRITPDHPLLGSRAELGLVATAHA